MFRSDNLIKSYNSYHILLRLVVGWEPRTPPRGQFFDRHVWPSDQNCSIDPYKQLRSVNKTCASIWNENDKLPIHRTPLLVLITKSVAFLTNHNICYTFWKNYFSHFCAIFEFNVVISMKSSYLFLCLYSRCRPVDLYGEFASFERVTFILYIYNEHVRKLNITLQW